MVCESHKRSIADTGTLDLGTNFISTTFLLRAGLIEGKDSLLVSNRYLSYNFKFY